MATTRNLVRRTVRVLSAVTAVAQTLPVPGPVAESVLNAVTVTLTVAELSLPWIDREWLVPVEVQRDTNAASNACTS